MVTNDVRPLAAPGAGPIYAALVNPKGKLLHDLLVWRGEDRPSATPGSGQQPQQLQRLLLDVDAAGAGGVLSWLARYKLRRPITLEAADGDLQVWAQWPCSSGGSGGDGGGGRACGGGGGGGGGGWLAGGGSGGWWADPRLQGGQLGERGVFGPGGPPGCSGRGSEGGEARHRLLRYGHGVPEGDSEMPAGGGGGGVARGAQQPRRNIPGPKAGAAPGGLRDGRCPSGPGARREDGPRCCTTRGSHIHPHPSHPLPPPSPDPTPPHPTPPHRCPNRPPERMSPLELNLDVLHGVSYTKGCYIGQVRP
jgi:hypothetical protein